MYYTQEEEPWWVTGIRTWLFMVSAMYECSEPGWAERVEYEVNTKPPEAIYELYEQFCSRPRQ